MMHSKHDPQGKGEDQQEIWILTLKDLDVAELETRLELASMLPADCWSNSCSGDGCSGNACSGNG